MVKRMTVLNLAAHSEVSFNCDAGLLAGEESDGLVHHRAVQQFDRAYHIRLPLGQSRLDCRTSKVEVGKVQMGKIPTTRRSAS
jgi:hypothetical protein